MKSLAFEHIHIHMHIIHHGVDVIDVTEVDLNLDLLEYRYTVDLLVDLSSASRSNSLG